MEIVLAENYGMCTGVRIAMRKAERVAAKYSGNGNMYTLGELVHNPHIIEYFERKGIHIAESLDEIESGTVIIRVHGVPESVKEKAREKGLKVVDATCGHVLKLKNLALQLEKDGAYVVMYGKPDHPEIIGVVENLNRYAVVSNVSEINNIPACKSIGLVSQTTMIPADYETVQKALEYKSECLRVEDTICSATQERQDSARELARNVDLMFVIGSSTSSNSKNLVNVCRSINGDSFLISCKDDLKPRYFNSAEKVGITASASTPGWIIDGVVEALRGM